MKAGRITLVGVGVLPVVGGLTDADIVQRREKPRHSGSAFSYLADVFRMGVRIESVSSRDSRSRCSPGAAASPSGARSRTR